MKPKQFLIFPVKPSISLVCHDSLALIELTDWFLSHLLKFKLELNIYLYRKIIHNYISILLWWHFKIIIKKQTESQEKAMSVIWDILGKTDLGRKKTVNKIHLWCYLTQKQTDLFISDIKNLIICVAKKAHIAFILTAQ